MFAVGPNTRNRMGADLPEKVQYWTEIPLKAKVTLVSCGIWHMVCVTESGHCLTAGNNKNGELGRNTNDSSFDVIENFEDCVSASAGFGVSFLITRNGDLFSCGKADISLHDKRQSKPRKVRGLENIKQVDCGMDFCASVTHDGILWMWGDNTFGQLGVSKVKYAEKPIQVTSISEPVV